MILAILLSAIVAVPGILFFFVLIGEAIDEHKALKVRDRRRIIARYEREELLLQRRRQSSPTRPFKRV